MKNLIWTQINTNEMNCQKRDHFDRLFVNQYINMKNADHVQPYPFIILR